MAELSVPIKSNWDTAWYLGNAKSEQMLGSTPQSDSSPAIGATEKGNAGITIAHSTNQFTSESRTQKENLLHPYHSESSNLGPSTIMRSTSLAADTNASCQLDPSGDSSMSCGKAGTQDNCHETPSLQLSPLSSPSLEPVRFDQTHCLQGRNDRRDEARDSFG